MKTLTVRTGNTLADSRTHNLTEQHRQPASHAFDNAHDGINLIAAAGRSLTLNRASEEITGCAAAETRGHLRNALHYHDAAVKPRWAMQPVRG